jgi:hypothetical protein
MPTSLDGSLVARLFASLKATVGRRGRRTERVEKQAREGGVADDLDPVAEQREDAVLRDEAVHFTRLRVDDFHDVVLDGGQPPAEIHLQLEHLLRILVKY